MRAPSHYQDRGIECVGSCVWSIHHEESINDIGSPLHPDWWVCNSTMSLSAGRLDVTVEECLSEMDTLYMYRFGSPGGLVCRRGLGSRHRQDELARGMPVAGSVPGLECYLHLSVRQYVARFVAMSKAGFHDTDGVISRRVGS